MGVLTVLALVVLLYVATIAQNGLPWESHYHITAVFPNAERLIPTDEVTIGGVQVGQVSTVTAVPSHTGRQPYVRVGLALNPSVGRLPVDTGTRILSSSVLGATYVQLMPGVSRHRLPAGGTLPLANAQNTTQLTDLFDIFNRATSRDIQQTLGELGTGLAGRGSALNATISNASHLLPSIVAVSRVLAAPSTRLGGFLEAYSSFAAALSPVATQLGGLVTGGSRTLGALASVRPALGSTINQLPSTETAATVALTRLTPSLDGLAQLATDLHPAAVVLPDALRQIDTTLAAGVRPMRQLPMFANRLRSTLVVVREVSRRKSTDGAVRKLTNVVTALRPTIDTLEPAQVYCNIIPVMLWNFASTLDSGYGIGQDGPPPVAFAITHIGAQGELLQQGKPSPNVDINYQPTENATECAGNNEPANGVTQRFNNPAGNVGHAHPNTAAPASSYAFARKAGLLATPAGWHP